MSDTNTSIVDVTSGSGAGMTPEQIEEHERKMMDLADGKKSDETDGEPQKILGKFNSQEDLEKAYIELQKKLGQGNNTDTSEDNSTTNQTENNTETDTNSNDLGIKKKEESTEENNVDSFKFDRDALAKEYQENEGKLTEDTVKKLNEIGIGEDVLDIYFEGIKAQEAQSSQEIFSEVGGKENYESIVGWASDNLTDNEIDAYNQALKGGNKDMVKMLLNGIKSKYEAVNGTSFKQTDASSSGGKGGQDVFANSGEALAAMKDPRYGKDSGYTNQVEAKIIRSNVF